MRINYKMMFWLCFTGLKNDLCDQGKVHVQTGTTLSQATIKKYRRIESKPLRDLIRDTLVWETIKLFKFTGDVSIYIKEAKTTSKGFQDRSLSAVR